MRMYHEFLRKRMSITQQDHCNWGGKVSAAEKIGQ